MFAYLPIKQGDTFTDDKASEAIRALYATGFFNDVRIATQGNVVIVQVQERPAIASIDFTGTKEFDKDNLTKALRAVGLADGRYYDKALVDKAEQELKRQYLTRGFYAAEVKTTVTPVDANRVSILFAVAEGRARRSARSTSSATRHSAPARCATKCSCRRRTGSPGTRRTTCTRRKSSPATSRRCARTI